jgi:hypothetical protein
VEAGRLGVSDYKAGDRVQFRPALVAGATVRRVFEVTEAGLESSVETMPGEQVRVRKQDGALVRLWVEDIELAPEAADGHG